MYTDPKEELRQRVIELGAKVDAIQKQIDMYENALERLDNDLNKVLRSEPISTASIQCLVVPRVCSNMCDWRRRSRK